MKQRSPQEKKSLSYAKDCRNTYGENDKSSRKNIPLKKARINRAYRKKVNTVLQQVNGEIDLEKADLVENVATSIKRDNWKKSPDMPLGKLVAGQLEHRKTQAGNGKTARKKIREFSASLEIEVEQVDENNWIARCSQPKPLEISANKKEKAIIRCRQEAEAIFLKELGAGT
jgi:hypothetical protein